MAKASLQKLNKDPAHQRMAVFYANKARADKRREYPTHRTWVLMKAMERASIDSVTYQATMSGMFFTASFVINNRLCMVHLYYASSTKLTRDRSRRLKEFCKSEKIPFLLLADNLTSSEMQVALELFKMRVARGDTPFLMKTKRRDTYEEW